MGHDGLEQTRGKSLIRSGSERAFRTFSSHLLVDDRASVADQQLRWTDRLLNNAQSEGHGPPIPFVPHLASRTQLAVLFLTRLLKSL